MRAGSTTWSDLTMTNFTLLGVAAILSTIIATPVMAQPAVQEPGLQAFYESLGVGSHDIPTTRAMSSARGSYASVPARRSSAKPRAQDVSRSSMSSKRRPNGGMKLVIGIL